MLNTCACGKCVYLHADLLFEDLRCIKVQPLLSVIGFREKVS